jgi:uncharacterized protein
MFKNIFIACLLLVQVCSAAVGFAEMSLPPKPAPGPSMYVQDYAGVLSTAAKQNIGALGQTLDQKTTAQLVVVTVKTLNDVPIEDYALGILRSWGLGTKEKNNGALILIAVNDRKSRIEVGYGLEGILPDGRTGRIQDEYMLPYFRKGQYEQGILQAYAATAQIIAKDAGVTLSGASKVQPQKTQNNFLGLDDDDMEMLIYIIIFLVIMFLSSRGGGSGPSHRSGYRGGFGGGGFGGGFGGGGGGFGGGGFGGGSGGGGGSSRGW